MDVDVGVIDASITATDVASDPSVGVKEVVIAYHFLKADNGDSVSDNELRTIIEDTGVSLNLTADDLGALKGEMDGALAEAEAQVVRSETGGGDRGGGGGDGGGAVAENAPVAQLTSDEIDRWCSN